MIYLINYEKSGDLISGFNDGNVHSSVRLLTSILLKATDDSRCERYHEPAHIVGYWRMRGRCAAMSDGKE